MIVVQLGVLDLWTLVTILPGSVSLAAHHHWRHGARPDLRHRRHLATLDDLYLWWRWSRDWLYWGWWWTAWWYHNWRLSWSRTIDQRVDDWMLGRRGRNTLHLGHCSGRRCGVRSSLGDRGRGWDWPGSWLLDWSRTCTWSGVWRQAWTVLWTVVVDTRLSSSLNIITW